MKQVLIALMLIVITTIACGSTPPNQSSTTQPANTQTLTILNDPTFQEIEEIQTQTENVNNCFGNQPEYKTGYTIQILKITSVEISVGAGGSIEGSPIPEVLKAEITAKIESAFQRTYGITEAQSREITLTQETGTYTSYQIVWRVKKAVGTLDVIDENGNKVQVKFEKIINIGQENLIPTPLQCDTNALISPTPSIESASTPSVIESTPTPLLASGLPTPSLSCFPLNLLGQVLDVSYDENYVTVKNISNSNMAFRISLDYNDPFAISTDPSISILNNNVRPSGEVKMPIRNNSSAQIWAWDSNRNCVDNFWLDIK